MWCGFIGKYIGQIFDQQESNCGFGNLILQHKGHLKTSQTSAWEVPDKLVDYQYNLPTMLKVNLVLNKFITN